MNKAEADRREQDRLDRRTSDQVRRSRDPSPEEWREACDILNSDAFLSVSND